MIVDSLSFVRDQINLFSNGGPQIELGNVSRYNTGEAFSEDWQNKILLSIINIEEDTVVRHVQHYRKENNQILFKNPPVFINLSLLFASTHVDYPSALLSLETVLLFFQKHWFFSIENSPELVAYNRVHDQQIEKMTFEIINLSIEQVAQLWGALGGHQMPSILYKMRMLPLDNPEGTAGEPIKEIKIETWHQKQ
ncbi:MAG TPA: DUF4255 domain-containing protein, partial [Flavisolibacter sp.]|nr:DUF4255 domain-containing protein [Flavisolibacter sp.]